MSLRNRIANEDPLWDVRDEECTHPSVRFDDAHLGGQPPDIVCDACGANWWYDDVAALYRRNVLLPPMPSAIV